MFPTLSSILEYFFGFSLEIPVPTFGVFVALSFVLAYLTFLSEFERKEKEGVIKPFVCSVKTPKSDVIIDFINYGILGFIIGLKVFGAFLHNQLFFKSPINFIFSFQGNWLLGLIFCVLFIFWAYIRQKANKRVNSENVQIHPKDLMPTLVMWAAIWGFLGAKLFNYFENFSLFANYSLLEFLQKSGLTFYGGLVVGGAAFLYIGYKNKMRLIDLTDIGSPGMLVAYGVGRIGCQLSGDGDWGVVNNSKKPVAWLPDWMWSFKFPHNVINQGEYIKGCGGKFCAILIEPVYPTSFYESVIIFCCFFIVWIFRRKIKIPGAMFCLYLLIVGTERFLIEEIRVNYKYHFFNFSLSEAQIISLLFLISGLVGFCILRASKLKYYHPTSK